MIVEAPAFHVYLPPVRRASMVPPCVLLAAFVAARASMLACGCVCHQRKLHAPVTTRFGAVPRCIIAFRRMQDVTSGTCVPRGPNPSNAQWFVTSLTGTKGRQPSPPAALLPELPAQPTAQPTGRPLPLMRLRAAAAHLRGSDLARISDRSGPASSPAPGVLLARPSLRCAPLCSAPPHVPPPGEDSPRDAQPAR